MSETELRLSQHRQALELHQKILTSATLAQQNLWDMCSGLKQMRDGKLYRELGYSNFEDYCENEVGFSREQGRKYISIIENVSLENANSSWHLGVSKLYLLSTISESEQQEISEKINLEETTVKQLKAEIDSLKGKNKELEESKAKAEKRADEAEFSKKLTQESYKRLEQVNHQHYENFNAEREKNQLLNDEIKQLESENEELRNRPIDVAVVDRPIENDPKFKEIVRSLERENMKRNEELEQQYREDEKAVRKMLEREKQQALSELRESYEKKLAELPKGEPVDEDKLKFKVYLTSAFDMLNRLMEFTSQHTDTIYKEKIRQLLNSILTKMEE